MKRTNWLLVAFLLINAIGCYADGMVFCMCRRKEMTGMPALCPTL